MKANEILDACEHVVPSRKSVRRGVCLPCASAAISAAVAEENEACAKVAEKMSSEALVLARAARKVTAYSIKPGPDEFDRRYQAEALTEAAKAIRSRRREGEGNG